MDDFVFSNMTCQLVELGSFNPIFTYFCRLEVKCVKLYQLSLARVSKFIVVVKSKVI